MKNYFLLFALVMIFDQSTGQTQHVHSDNLLGMSYHDNVVKMPLSAKGYKNISASYTITEFSVSKDQDPDGKIYDGLKKTYTGNDGSMTFKVGRHGTSAVAKWFTARVSANETTFNHDPGKLNFAFLGTLKLTLTGGELGKNQDTYTLKGAAIAQGHVGASNNWWFGGTNCKYTSSHKCECEAKSSTGYPVKLTFERGGNGVNKIDLVDINYTPYKTSNLQRRYIGENGGCVWQLPALCPPYVIYYNKSQRQALKLTVKNNKLYNAQGKLFDTQGADWSHSGRAAIFVMDQEGNIYASNANKIYLLHHSSILAGGSVAASGELFVNNGVISKATNCSGHYQQGNFVFEQLKESLKRQGYSRSYLTKSCSPEDLIIDLEYNVVGD